MAKRRNTRFADIVIEHYTAFNLFGLIMVAISIWLYEYHYAVTSDDLIGILAACALFFGTLLLGTGIRGWRDGEGYRNRYIHMKARGGAELQIRKRKKKKW